MTGPSKPRLAIVSSHPIQYNAPLFREVAKSLPIRVFYSWEGTRNKADPDFQRAISWDIPLLEGYESTFVANRARSPGTHHFRGLDNPGMIGAIEAWRPDALLVYGWASKTHLGILRHFKGRVPVLFRGDSTPLSGGRAMKKLLRSVALRWVYRHVDLALYPGEWNREYLRSSGVPEAKMAWMPHAVDNARFSDNGGEYEAAAAAWRRKLGIDPNAVVFLYAGKLVARKQPQMLLCAFIDAHWQSNPPHLIFVGSGVLEQELRASAVRSERVHFLGFRNQSEMPVMYRLGDVLVLPSRAETWGLAVNEAMACSRCVLVSDRVGCVPEMVRDRSFAWSFASDDEYDLRRQLVTLASTKPCLMEQGLAARLHIDAWSIENAARHLVAAATEITENLRLA